MKIKVKSVKDSRKLRNKQKKEKGITLVALIITVVVMLILAGIAISAIVRGEGLFSKVREAVGIYENVQQKEQEEISNLINEIENYNKIFIYTKEDLEQFRDNVNNGNTYKGMIVMLMNDIDLGGNENDESTWWEPIGFNSSLDPDSNYVSEKTFSGIFEGNNYTIEGVYLKVELGQQSAGFFSCINNAKINNLNVSGDIILGPNIGKTTNLMGGGIVGVAFGNCVISNCINSINVTKLSSNRDVAGIVGAVDQIGDYETKVEIKNCINYGNITGSNNCGGIVGSVTRGNLLIENTCNKGNVTNYLGSYAGGLLGRTQQEENYLILIENSHNEGVIKGRGIIGGLIGVICDDIIISDSYNNAEIYNGQRTANSYIGGLVGRVYSSLTNCTLINSYNTGNINIEEGKYNTRVGGLIGETRTTNTNIYNSYNIGNISNGTYVSGICGQAYATDGIASIVNIKNIYSVGNISGQNTRGIMIIADDNSHITVNAENVYLLDTVSDVGISNLDASNPIEIPVESLSEENMKSEEFVNELNTNLSSIDMEYDLRRWKYVSGSYPVFE